MEQFARPARCWPMTPAMELSTPEPRTLLLVHGDILVRTALAAYLRECGYDVVEAGTTEEAIEALRLDMKFDLAFLDVQGDEGAGFQLAQIIRKHRPAVRVVLAAGVPRAAAEAGELCEQGPAQRKPYDHRTLERHIRRLLAR
jgi:DNA-binding NtrC family response regulator